MTMNALPFDAIDVTAQLEEMYSPSAVARSQVVFEKLVDGLWGYVAPVCEPEKAVVH